MRTLATDALVQKEPTDAAEREQRVLAHFAKPQGGKDRKAGLIRTILLSLEDSYNLAILNQHQHIVVDVVVSGLREGLDELHLQILVLRAEHLGRAKVREAQSEFIACSILTEKAVASATATQAILVQNDIERIDW